MENQACYQVYLDYAIICSSLFRQNVNFSPEFSKTTQTGYFEENIIDTFIILTIVFSSNLNEITDYFNTPSYFLKRNTVYKAKSPN